MSDQFPYETVVLTGRMLPVAALRFVERVVWDGNGKELRLQVLQQLVYDSGESTYKWQSVPFVENVPLPREDIP